MPLRAAPTTVTRLPLTSKSLTITCHQPHRSFNVVRLNNANTIPRITNRVITFGSLQPTSFEDVAALVALYRPGPMAQNWHNAYADRKNGRKPVEYPHPDLSEVLEPTYGLMIYQEQLMRVAQRLAGYSLSEADTLRKAAAKKKRDLMAKERSKFVDSVERQGYD